MSPPHQNNKRVESSQRVQNSFGFANDNIKNKWKLSSGLMNSKRNKLSKITQNESKNIPNAIWIQNQNLTDQIPQVMWDSISSFEKNKMHDIQSSSIYINNAQSDSWNKTRNPGG